MSTIAARGTSVLLLVQCTIACAGLPAIADLTAGAQAAAAFAAVWDRSDGPVRDGRVSRTWTWGPALGEIEREEYVDAPGGGRYVRYFEKSRMELTDPDGDPRSAWYVTNGLLVVEMATGQLQLGDTSFVQRAPAAVNVAGDLDDPTAPTYQTIGMLRAAPPLADGALIVQRIDRDGRVVDDPHLAGYGVNAVHRVQAPGIDHQVASPFWAFMQATGPVYLDGTLVDAPLFPDPFFGTGLPLTEAYWTTVRVGGIARDVLVQCFERRCLTYTPANPPGWQVETGNVGLHYRAWRYGAEPPTPEPTATAPATPTARADPALVAIGPGAVDSWMRSVVRDADDVVWVVALNNNAAFSGTGPGEVRVYRATSPGVPTGFAEVTSARRSATGLAPIPFADAAIDGDGRLHVAWLDRGADGQPVMYAVFDLDTAQWIGDPTPAALTRLSGFGGNAGQGGISIAIGHDGAVRIAYCAAGAHTQIYVVTKAGAGWSAPETPAPVANAFVWHPALAVGPGGEWLLAMYDATNRRILAARRGVTGWDAQVVAQDVLGPESIDQGPALLVTPTGTPVVAYLDGDSYLRLSALTGGAWRDLPLGGDYFTHAPGLGVAADGTLIAAGHDQGSPPSGIFAVAGRDGQWRAWRLLVAIPADGSHVFRWAGAFSAPGAVVDLVFFDEDSNDDGVLDDQTLYYVAVPPGW